MKLYFSDIKPIIISQLETASKEILIAVSWLTDRELFSILLNKLKAGIAVSIITRNDYLNNHNEALPWQQFINLGGALRFCQAGKMLHYKFCVIDNNKAFVTSYNWTCFAGTNNRENIMLIDDSNAIESFTDEFNFLCLQFPLETNPPRINLQSVNNKLHGFYELTLEDDAKNQTFIALDSE
jgi:phosphatidylserine/phosphatidylglycerophosphate/cardiolipin synthase-like enzyme